MRCFVAVVPPTKTAAQIEQHIDEFSRNLPNALGVKRIATADLHLTLAFLGTLQPEKAQKVAAALAQVDAHHFPTATWVLDRVGWFEGARVLWLGATLTPVLQLYVGQVHAMLSELDVAFDTRPFIPHVSIFRDVKSPLPPLAAQLFKAQFSVTWPLERPVLMESLPTVRSMRYRQVKAHT